ncbi:MAG: ABC transporter permease [Lachnospiraceae bacterium]|jgi:NitT/TauT family transport system permease protein/sulfonate transport system permease protein|nr:ABC transporter permease [Lachnospiraceae bacterium]
MKKRESLRKSVWTIISLVTLFLIWYLGSRNEELGRLMPDPVEVLKFIAAGFVVPIGKKLLWEHILWSLSRVLIGYVLACIVGILLGFAASWFKVGEAVIRPFYLLLRSIPSLAWIPLAILWFGIGEKSKYFIIFITAVMIIMTNVMDGVKAVSPELLGVARMLGTKEKQLFVHVVLPCAVPQIFNGLQVAVGSAWAAVLAAEMVRSSEGVGWIILAGQSSMNMVQIFAGIVVIGMIGLLLALLIRAAERRLCAWNVRGK